MVECASYNAKVRSADPADRGATIVIKLKSFGLITLLIDTLGGWCNR